MMKQSQKVMGEENKKIKKTYAIVVVLLLTMCSFSLGGCSNSSKVIYPVEVVEKQEEKPEEIVINIQDEDEEEEVVEEKTAEEEFVLLEPDEPEAEDDDEGNKITEDGKLIVDLVFFMGQSNMSGAGGDAKLAPPVKEGTGYEFRAISDPTKLYPITEPFGKNESFIGGICDIPGAKKGSLVSAFVNEYYLETGVPVVCVSASQGASTTELWQTPGFQYDMKERYDRAVVWLESSNYHIRNRYAVWFQGESDAANHVDPEVYKTNMDNIIRPMFISGLNKVFIVTPGRTLSIKNYFSEIIDEQLMMCKTSGYYALATNLLSGVASSYMVDEWHYGQPVLNLIGVETAKSVAFYTLNQTERIDYDYKNGCAFIPEGNGYNGDETCDPLDLKNVQKIVDEYYDEYLRRVNENSEEYQDMDIEEAE